MSLVPLLSTKIGVSEVEVGAWGLPGYLAVPEQAFGLVIFAHGSGSGRLSPRNRAVSDALNRVGMATLLFDLLRPEEEIAQNRAKVFDIQLLATRLVDAVGCPRHRRGDDPGL